MAQNSTNTTDRESFCVLPESIQRFCEISWNIFYHFVTPAHFVFGLPAHVVSLITFYKQCKQESGYNYQVVVAVNKILALISFVLYVISDNWFSGMGPDKAEWFVRSYPLMWFAAHLAVPLSNTFMSASVLLSLCVAADRLFALGAPLTYRNVNHRRHRIVACSFCFLISAITNIVHTIEFVVGESVGGDGYVLLWDDEVADHPLSNLLDRASDVIYIGGTSLIVVCNALVIHLYRKRTKAVSSLTNNNPGKEAQRKLHEKTLVILTIYESFTVLISSFAVAAFYIAIYVDSWFSHCGYIAFQPLQNGVVEITDSLQFYGIFVISGQFRKMVFEAVPFLGRIMGHSGAGQTIVVQLKRTTA